MKKVLFLALLLCGSFYGFSQNANFWTATDVSKSQSTTLERANSPSFFYLFELDVDQITSSLNNSRMRGDLRKYRLALSCTAEYENIFLK